MKQKKGKDKEAPPMIDISARLSGFEKHLYQQEASPHTISKYLRDVRLLAQISGSLLRSVDQLIFFKKELLSRRYAVRSINSMLSAVNKFLTFCGFPQWKLRFLKVQRTVFCPEARLISRQEYQCLIQAAQQRGDERLALLLQTLCATGIRVSEVKAITVSAVQNGLAEIHSKGKIRTILIPQSLCRLLQEYAQRRGIAQGCLFRSRKGRPLDRSSIWRQMKGLCLSAGVDRCKVFPHNLRHLFARCFYQQHKDIVGLADILGHSSMDTTRIYTIKDSRSERQRLEVLGLVNDNEKETHNPYYVVYMDESVRN